jgi:hypothetical protein
VNDPELPYRVVLQLFAPASDEWRVTSLELTRMPSGPALRTETLSRIPLDGYLALAADRLGPARSSPPEAGSGPGETGPTPRAQALRQGIDPDTLVTVARVYREALASPVRRERMAPTAAVARAFRIDRNVAGRLVHGPAARACCTRPSAASPTRPHHTRGRTPGPAPISRTWRGQAVRAQRADDG